MLDTTSANIILNNTGKQRDTRINNLLQFKSFLTVITMELIKNYSGERYDNYCKFLSKVPKSEPQYMFAVTCFKRFNTTVEVDDDLFKQSIQYFVASEGCKKALNKFVDFLKEHKEITGYDFEFKPYEINNIK